MKRSLINKTMFCNFIEQTLEHAKAMLTKTDFPRIVFKILENENYSFYQKMYIKAVRIYILPVYVYRLQFSFQDWQELLKVCVNLYPCQSSSSDKRNLLKTIQSIVEYGCLESHLTLILKKLLPILGKDIFLKWFRKVFVEI